MNPMSEYGETESAVEKLATKTNGDRTTMRELKELLLAVHHDSRARDKRILDKIDEHSSKKYHVTKEEFDGIIEVFCKKHEDRDKKIDHIELDLDESVKTLEKELLEIRDNCIRMHLREPRRSTDAQTENWGVSVFGGDEDEEAGDMRRAWRTLRWFVLAAGGAFLVAVGTELSHLIFGG